MWGRCSVIARNVLREADRMMQFPKRKNIRLKNFNYSQPNYVYFVTICAAESHKPFLNEKMANAITESIDFLRSRKNLLVFAYCLMPDHLHLLVSLPGKSESLSKIIKDFKSYTTKIYREYMNQSSLCQRGFYDHIVRRNEDLRQICEYILDNPARKGLVKNSKDYEYSGIFDPLRV